MLETLLTILYIFLSVSPKILSPIIPMVVGAIIARRGKTEDNSIVWAIGVATLALGAAVELWAILSLALLVFPML